MSAYVERSGPTSDDRHLTVTAHLSCDSCLSPDINSCKSVSPDCRVMSAHCPEGTALDSSRAGEPGTLQCFAEHGHYPKDLAKRLGDICVEEHHATPSSLLAK